VQVFLREKLGPKSAALKICKVARAGRRVSIAYVVGATHFPWVGAAIETQFATSSALPDCLAHNGYAQPDRWVRGALEAGGTVAADGGVTAISGRGFCLA
jgi:hypothetical protein